MLKALGSFLGIATNKTKLLDLCLDYVSEQVGSRLSVSNMMLEAVATEGSQTLILPPSRCPLMTLPANLYVCREEVPVEVVRQEKTLEVQWELCSGP